MPAKPPLVVTVAVLAAAAERPRHAYEIWSTMRLRGQDHRLGTSSTAVYDAVRRLARDGLRPTDATGTAVGLSAPSIEPLRGACRSSRAASPTCWRTLATTCAVSSWA